MVSLTLGDFYGAIVARIILGFLQGPVFPCLSAFVAPWFAINLAALLEFDVIFRIICVSVVHFRYPVKQRATLCSLGYIGLSVWFKI